MSHSIQLSSDETTPKSLDRLEEEVRQLLDDARSLRKLGKYGEAIILLEQVLNRSPSNSEAISNYAKLTYHYSRDLSFCGKTQQAYDLFERVLELEPNELRLLSAYGNCATRAKAYGKANKLFNRALQLDQQNIPTLNSYAKCLIDQEKYSEACELFDRALKLDKNNIITLTSYATALVHCEKYSDAFDLFDRALQLNQENIPILNSYANCLTDQEKYSEACELFDRSLKLDQNNVRTLNQYATTLMQLSKYEKAYELLDKCLKLEAKNIYTLNIYANGLIQQSKYQEACELFDRALKLDKNNIVTLTSYSNVLVHCEKYSDAFDLFDRKLEIKGDDVHTLSFYANVLVQCGKYERASELFERSLKLDPNDVITLNRYATALVYQKEYEKAGKIFDRSLKLDPNDVITLNKYANSLVCQKEYEKASQLLLLSLKLDPNDSITLCSYANILGRQGEFERAFRLFENALKLNKNDVITLNRYANLLIQNKDFRKAAELFDHSLDIDGNNIFTLNSYADALTQEGRYEEASSLLVHALKLDTENIRTINTYSYVQFKYAHQLESSGKHREALECLLSIPLEKQQKDDSNVIRLNLGRLYFRLNQSENGLRLFDQAISDSNDADQSRLYAARSLLVNRPNSEEAINLLLQIEKNSPHYIAAMEALSLNVDEQTAYQLFSAKQEGLENSEMVYRSMYHKIGNEVAILKSIAQRLLRKIQGNHPLVAEIAQDLEDLQARITHQRTAQKRAILGIPSQDYRQLLEVISQTAHNISDWVNNQLAVIESKTRRAMRSLDTKDLHYEKFQELLRQLELTQTALNDLKSINEGITIRHNHFPVCRLFEKWQPAVWSKIPRIQKARIKLAIDNPDVEFDGDEEKIKSILNELVENSLKHNSDSSDLFIRISARDILNPQDISGPTIPGDRRFLYIQFTDNGKGVPVDRKDWIFQPLHTTSSEEKGSGLGLFIARKTIQKMGGFIRESGKPGKGAKFQIYLPYSDVEYSCM